MDAQFSTESLADSEVDSRVVSLYGRDVYDHRLTRLTRIQVLHLSRIPAMPNCLARLSTLRSLTISATDTVAIPEDMGYLRNLALLTVHFCHLSRPIPSSIVNCSALSHISLMGCGLQEIPVVFSRLRALDILQACHNHIREVPEWTSRLRALGISDNPIVRVHSCYGDTQLAKRIGTFTAIRVEYCSEYGDMLREPRHDFHPETIAFLETLEWIHL